MPDVRRELYTRLIEFMYQQLEDYYLNNPGLYPDERAIKAIAASRDGLAGILNILDDYQISRKPKQ